MNQKSIQKILTFCIALIWLVNGLFCKVLDLVPRHEEIVARILGDEYSGILIMLIGIAEIVMAIWILSGFMKRFNAITQMIVIGTMNILEFLLAPDLLLWGKMNSFYAFILILVIYYNEFHLNKPKLQ